ncbi:MAG: energy transducer TonB [Balneolaceae bacterium]|nr:energy transducer TonB [Balneolaceae bacterium]MCH8548384.1 energy transducer TonB [Balneolaceae bacterium]
MKYILTFIVPFAVLSTACSTSERVSGADCISEVEELTIPENSNFLTYEEIRNQVTKSDDSIDYTLPEPDGGMFELMRNVRFPPSASDLTETHEVLIQALIDENGEVLDMVLLEPARCDITESAMEAIERTDFSPGTLNSEPIVTTMDIPINFGSENPVTIQPR